IRSDVMGESRPDDGLAVKREKNTSRRHAPREVPVVGQSRLPLRLVSPHQQCVESSVIHTPADFAPAAFPLVRAEIQVAPWPIVITSQIILLSRYRAVLAQSGDCCFGCTRSSLRIGTLLRRSR